ncbi:hypothetical protein MMC17_010071 [Xylographa soralifera]|nr:hypothetical protein [Xylographa soralifera]
MLHFQLFSMCCTILSLFTLLHHIPTTLAQLQIQLNFYTDGQCQVSSTEHASASVSISECLVTTGLVSISYNPVSCTSGDAVLLGFSDTACGTQLGGSDWFHSNECFARYEGDIAAVLLTCSQKNSAGDVDPGTPTATSTILVGPVADAAPTPTQATTSNAPASQTAALASPTSSNDSGSGTGTSGTSGNSTSGSSTGSASTPSPSSEPKLSTSDIISLGVGLGVGIPTLILTYLGYRAYRRR